jgi:integrase
MQVGSYKVGKVYFKASHSCHYVKVTHPDGRREDRKLDPDRDKSETLYCDLVTDLKRKGVPDKDWLVQDLVDEFLDHVKVNNAPLTYRWYRDFLKSFCLTLPPKLKVRDIKFHHVHAWLDKSYPATRSTNTRHDAVSCVKRVFNWASKDMGYLTASPLAAFKKPPKTPRQTFVTAEQWQTVLDGLREDAFKDFLRFLLLTGCRPQEARIITKGDIRGKTVFLESVPGKKGSRTILLTDSAKAILDKWAKVYPDGPVLRNNRGRAWKHDALNCRFQRIKKKTNLPVCCYLARHSAAVQLLEAGASAGAAGAILGHKDATMVLRVYGKHINDREAHLRQCLTNALKPL